jgi:hypothetical protein
VFQILVDVLPKDGIIYRIFEIVEQVIPRHLFHSRSKEEEGTYIFLIKQVPVGYTI